MAIKKAVKSLAVAAGMFLLTALLYPPSGNAGLFDDIVDIFRDEPKQNLPSQKKPSQKPPESPPEAKPSNPPKLELQPLQKEEKTPEKKCQENEILHEGECIERLQ